jgi:hypothetical protein
MFKSNDVQKLARSSLFLKNAVTDIAKNHPIVFCHALSEISLRLLVAEEELENKDKAKFASQIKALNFATEILRKYTKQHLAEIKNK